MTMEKTIRCPLVNRLVTDDFCFDTSVVAEGHTPERFLPDELTWSKELVEACMNCPNHRYD